MATQVDLGKIRPVWKGDWAASTAYEQNDMVKVGVDSYICTAAHTSGSTFADTNWDTLAVGAELPSQTGYAGKVLTTDGSTLSWGQGGGVVQVKSFTWTNQGSFTQTPSGAVYPYTERSFTPILTGSWTLVTYRLMEEGGDAWNTGLHLRRNGTVINSPGGTGVTVMPVQTYGAGGNDSSTPEFIFFTTLDKTGNTAGSAITYDLLKKTTDGNNYTTWFNRCFGGANASDEFGISEVIFMEVVAS
jgi:hypothetical protein